MAIYDYWLNPLVPVPTQVIGYRGEITDFPHDLYSYLLSTIREHDQNDIALIWRWLQPMQQFWESQYAQILAIPYLLSPEDCPEPYLDYLRKQIGIMDDMGYLWGVLEEADQRRLIKFFVRFLKYRATTFGLGEMLEAMTGLPVIIRGYFQFRWLLGGEIDSEIETALGREDEGYDPYLLSEHDLAVGVTPDLVEVNSYGGSLHYKFRLDGLMATVDELPRPEFVYIKFFGTGAGDFATLFYEGGNWWAQMDPDYLFLQPTSSYSLEETNFRASFESDELISDVMIEDDGDLNRDMVQGLVRFSRPQSERVYIRYYNLIELFSSSSVYNLVDPDGTVVDTELSRWDLLAGSFTWSEDDRSITLSDGSVDTRVRCNLTGSEDWTTYCVHVKMLHSVNEKYTQIRFMVQGNNDYYNLVLTPAEPPDIPAGTWQLYRVVSGVSTLLISGELDWFDEGVDYFWRIESITSDRVGGQVQVLRVYQDENLLTTYEDDPAPWSGNAKGTVELVVETGGSCTVSSVYVHELPMDSGFVGP